MYCGNCLRDNALVAALRRQGHQVLMVPLYLPLTLDETDESAGTPIFFGGINVYLEQQSAVFRHLPDWMHDWLSSPRLLKWAAGRAANTRAADLGALTLSMLRGESGNQARELHELIAWLKTQPKADAIFLSNVLLVGMARKLRQELNTPVMCTFQGEHFFLDSLPEPFRSSCWKTLAERTKELDLLISPSQFFADLMRERLGLPAENVRVVWNGIQLAGWEQAQSDSAAGSSAAPVLGYFARLCPEKGLDTLVAAYIELRRRGQVPGLRLRVGGSLGPADEPFVEGLRRQLSEAGLQNDVEFCPNVDHAAKVSFLRSLTVFSVPALYGEAFGLYLLEALAAGVPVVQPRSGAFQELVAATGGGMICEPGDPTALADALEELLLDPQKRRAYAEAGRRAVYERFNSDVMARNVAEVVASTQRCVAA
jgi:glycosyltransferase involved in cell wall biosynthesis